MTEPLVDQDFESKYGHLTRPLKEAAACWDIDLRDVMDSFLSAQNDDYTSLDPTHMLNFAQAGMLVSSTATNYGRKVEHLYTLVYSTLDTMSKGEGKSLASNSLIKRMRKRIVGFQEFENGFELLDSRVQPGKGIDLASDDGATKRSHLIQRVPLLLLPREESSDKSSGIKDQAVAKQSANGTEYKTSSCWISKSRCLLLDPEFSIYEESMLRHSVTARASLAGPLISAPMQAPDVLPLDNGRLDLDDSVPEFLDPVENHAVESPGLVASPAAFPPLPPKREREVATIEPVKIDFKPAIDAFAFIDPHAVPPNSRNLKPRFGRCHENPVPLKSLMDMSDSKLDLFSAESSLLEGLGSGTKDALKLGSVAGLEPFKSMIALKIREGKRKAAQAARERRKEMAEKLNNGAAPIETSEDEDDRPHAASGRMSVMSRRDSVDSVPPELEAVARKVSLLPVQVERERIAGLEKVLESSKHMYDELMKQKLAEMIGASNNDESEERSGNTAAGGSSIAALVAAAGNSVQEKIPELYASIRRWQDNLEPLLEEQTSRPVFDLDDYLVSIIDKLKSTNEEPAPEEQSAAISEFLRSVGADDDDSMSDSSPRAAQKSGPISSFEDLVKGEPKWNVCRLFLSTLILTNNGNVEIFNDTSNNEEELPLASPERVPATPARPVAARTPAAKVTPVETVAVAGTPLRGSHVFGAGHSFQVKLRNADKNLKFAIQDNAAVVSGVIPIMTNRDVPAPEPIGDVPFAEDD
jgi:hypothetical protein